MCEISKRMKRLERDFKKGRFFELRMNYIFKSIYKIKDTRRVVVFVVFSKNSKKSLREKHQHKVCVLDASKSEKVFLNFETILGLNRRIHELFVL